MLAVPWANGVLVPCSTRWGPTEIGYALADSGAEILFVDDAFAGLAARRSAGVRTVIHVGDGPRPDGMLSYEDLMREARPVDDACRGGDALAALMYTRGHHRNPEGRDAQPRSLVQRPRRADSGGPASSWPPRCPTCPG
jgi:acyl-CoA synthetase (AMP-forming)/AMP-acid ligase II